MVVFRTCSARRGDGMPCEAAPLRDGTHCLWHDPAHADEVAEGRRLGGLRRRRETAVLGAFDFEGLATVPQIRRLVEVAVIDALSLENSVQRARTLAYLAQTAARLLEAGEIEQRLDRIESALGPALDGRRR
jgi:hypothetical protein